MQRLGLRFGQVELVVQVRYEQRLAGAQLGVHGIQRVDADGRAWVSREAVETERKAERILFLFLLSLLSLSVSY